MAEHEQLNQVPARDHDNSRARALSVASIQGAPFQPPTAGKSDRYPAALQTSGVAKVPFFGFTFANPKLERS